MGVLYIRGEDGKFVPIKSIKGASAYEQAREGGYKGTEEEFIAFLNGLTKASDVGALSLTGGTLTGKDLYFDNGNARISGGQDYVQLDVFDAPKDDANRRNLVLNGKNSTDLKDAIVLTTKENGEGSTYAIYGEHNKPEASDVGALPLTGGTLSNSTLGLGGGIGQVIGGETYSAIVALDKDNGTNSRMLRVINPDLASYPLAKAVQLKVITNGTETEYNLFGEHNASELGLARIATGSYVGTGYCGISNPNTVTLDFTPKIFMVGENSNTGTSQYAVRTMIWNYGKNRAMVVEQVDDSVYFRTVYFTCLNNTASWYYATSSGIQYQMNNSGQAYYWVAIG